MITVRQLVDTCGDILLDDNVRIMHQGEYYRDCTVRELLSLYETEKVVTFMTIQGTMHIYLSMF